ncbi:MAG: single-stranded-DNA-specific exonuclease RecJ, partial [Phormidesmis sp. CAN_BIN36]|nr:single-stranded-DNA-specific exonuclease RecJ [Phormidesmis sp. CAN_BIN36]
FEQLAGYLNPDDYQPVSPFEFGQEMHWAVDRLQQAHQAGETIAIWGDIDADGVTATAVLWDGLGQFFTQNQQLFYYIPNRLTESHGLSHRGISLLNEKGCRLIVTCDTGSTNLAEIDYANGLGIDVIVTDHHTLPTQRPPVKAIVNSRYFPKDHPLASLSGVAVAYKLVEALYETLPEVPREPLNHLLDLVAIGLIADLVELKGDCRYLAQKGIQQLQTHSQRQPSEQTRPGITRLLELCKRTGDRPTDISFGLGPRINAVSRIQGDAHFCVELLTSRDIQRCCELAEATELANSRRKALQKDVAQQVADKLAHLDLSTTSVIVLWDEQWSAGVLGLVAGQIAQEYGRPTILLTTEQNSIDSVQTPALARGSARSVNQIDLYQLVKDQEHLLHRFGGHPFAAGLSLNVENLPLFTQAINQRLRQQIGDIDTIAPSIQADLKVTVQELGAELYRELRLIEPCGMGNPIPKLLIQDCWFKIGKHRNIQDWKGQKIRYIQTLFKIGDDSASASFPGVWWGHYSYEIPQGRCDAIVELENNTYRKQYEVRLVAVRPCIDSIQSRPTQIDWIVDQRQGNSCDRSDYLKVQTCPASWNELQAWFRRAIREQKVLAIAYPSPALNPPSEIWQTLIGIAKYLSRTGKTATRQQIYKQLEIGDRALKNGFLALKLLGFQVTYPEHSFQVTWEAVEASIVPQAQAKTMQNFFAAVQEEQFQRQYFYQVPLSTIQKVAYQTTFRD